MNFNSLEFLILFLPITVVAFYAVQMRWRLWVLVTASLIFYGVSGFAVLLAFLIAIFWGYWTAFLLVKWPKTSTPGASSDSFTRKWARLPQDSSSSETVALHHGVANLKRIQVPAMRAQFKEPLRIESGAGT